MGREIAEGRFSRRDFLHFERRLTAETELLGRWFSTGRLSSRHGVGGLELEAWLVDRRGCPAPINEPFLARLGDALVGPELSRFNVELNSTPEPLHGDAIRRMHDELGHTWNRCRQAAGELDARIAMIGILPTVTEKMLTLKNMSGMTRYRALNEQVLRIRGGRPLRLDIEGTHQHLHTEHADVMLEAGTTSFQIHLQVDVQHAARYYNAMLVLAGPLLAASVNSPLLFGRRLWQETRIPLFEQAVAVGGFEAAAFGPVKRVTFGTGYVRGSLYELFRENREHYPVLLPVMLDEPEEGLAHLQLQNGTIWRWVRPLVGFDADGTPHLRLEQRVVPAGPTVLDGMANAALLFGLAAALGEQTPSPESRLPFSVARDNFYAAARFGPAARLGWLDGRRTTAAALLLRELLPLALDGLVRLGCDRKDAQDYLGVVRQRVERGRTGARWQLERMDQNGDDATELVNAYLERQESGLPVAEWPP